MAKYLKTPGTGGLSPQGPGGVHPQPSSVYAPVVQGSGPPISGGGANSQFYLDTSTSPAILYINVNGTWIQVANSNSNVPGRDGEDGLDGWPGPPGAPGSSGPAGVSASPRTIIQSVQNAYNATNTGTPTIVWNSGPVQGNLLILVAAVRDNAGPPSAASGWTVLATSADSGSTGAYVAVYYKYAGASELTSQQFDTATTRNQWCVAGWEVAGVSGVISTDVIATHLNPAALVSSTAASYNTASFNTVQPYEMVLGGLLFQRLTGGGYSVAANTGPTVTNNGLFNGTADAFGSIDSALGGSSAIATSAGTAVSWTVSIVPAAGVFAEYGLLELASGPSGIAGPQGPQGPIGFGFDGEDGSDTWPIGITVSSVFGRTGSIVAATNDYGFSQITGSVADGQLSANVPLKNASNTFSAQQTIDAGTGNGSLSLAGGTISMAVTMANYRTGTAGPVWNSKKARGGSSSTPATVVTNDQLGSFVFLGYGTTGFQSGAQLVATVIETTPSDTAMGSRVILSVTPIGSASTTEVLRVEAGTGLSMFGANPVINANRSFRTPASTTTTAGLNLPHGSAPTSPSNGDCWTTTTGVYAQINGSTIGPLLANNGSFIGVQASAYSQQVPVTGFSITVGNGVSSLILDPAGTLATGTVTMPATPVDGHEVTIASSKVITALTVSANTGQSIDGAATTLSANGFAKWKYVLANTTWYRVG